tara:strand:- start:377 stop:856 length:480 start_codon:yes stop_codon:yes gene_type:complete
VRARQETLERIAGSYPHEYSNDPDVIEAWLARAQTLSPFFLSGMMLVLKDGTLRASSTPASAAAYHDALFGDTQWLRSILNSGGPQISPPFKDTHQNTAMIAFGVGVRDQSGAITAVLVGLTQLDAAGFLQELNTQKWGNGGSHLITAGKCIRSGKRLT